MFGSQLKSSIKKNDSHILHRLGWMTHVLADTDISKVNHLFLFFLYISLKLKFQLTTL